MQDMVDDEKTVEELDEIESKLDEQLASAGFLDRLDCTIDIVLALALLPRHNSMQLIKVTSIMCWIKEYSYSGL